MGERTAVGRSVDLRCCVGPSSAVALMFTAILVVALAVPKAAAQSPAGAAAPTPVPAAKGQETAAPAAQAGAPQQPEAAELVLNERLVVTFRAWVGPRSPRERAGGALKRIQALVRERVDPTVTARKEPEGMLVVIAQTPVFLIAPGDLDPLSDETLEQATARAVLHLQVAFNEEREERSASALIHSGALSLVATLVFILLMRWLLAGRRAVLRRLLENRAGRLHEIGVAGFTFVEKGQVTRMLRGAVGVLSLVVGLVFTYVWLAYVLREFPYSRPWGEALGSFLFTTFKNLGVGILQAVPKLFVVVVIVFLARLVARLVVSFFDAVYRGEVEVAWLPAESAKPTKPIALVLVWMIAITVAYPYLPGSGTDVFKGLSVFLGVLVSLGSSGLVNQAMAGISLMYSRALKPGDYVLVSGTEGTVTSFGLLAIKIMTPRQEEVTIPNAVVVANLTTNYSRPGTESGVILHTNVTIGYDAPWRQVHAMLLAAAEKTPGLRREPKPFVCQRSLSDFYVDYEINACMEDPHDRIAVLSALNANIQDAFNEHGVQIMSPHYLGDPTQAKIVPKEQWYRPPARQEGS
jgi:small-conductance mechanosensitive channel